MSENKGFVEKTKEAASSVKESVKDSFQQVSGNSSETGSAGTVRSGHTNEKASEKGYWDDKNVAYQGPEGEQLARLDDPHHHHNKNEMLSNS